MLPDMSKSDKVSENTDYNSVIWNNAPLYWLVFISMKGIDINQM